MEEFEAAYASWRALPFPPGSNDDSLDDLHSDIAVADTWVAESVVPYVQDGRYRPAQVEVVAELQRLSRRAAELGSAVDGDNERLAGDYLEYIEIMSRLYQLFLTRARRDPSE